MITFQKLDDENDSAVTTILEHALLEDVQSHRILRESVSNYNENEMDLFFIVLLINH